MREAGTPRISPARLALAVRRLQAEKEDLRLIASDPIAIIGMGCRFPGDIHSPQEFWRALKEGRDGIGEVPEGRWKDSASLPQQLRRGGYLSHVDQFDAAYFGISPREAQLMDPQQRLLLEVAWESLWDAGIDPPSLAGTDAGVFVAIYNNDYSRLHFRNTSSLTAHGGIGSAHSVAAGRLSFLLNLKGPSMAVDTACSSSLIATHLACQSLRNRECSLAIVGASSLKLLSDEVVVFSKWGMLASDGKCKTFDVGADGFVPGEGSGAVILKRLSDALQDGDRVRAVIRGTAVNHDGKTTVLTAPNGLAQESVLYAALTNAMLEPADISYIETHGTGTALGDPIEIEAIRSVYGQSGTGSLSCILGAVKTNLGHLEAAAGMAGMIKTVLCLEQSEIPRNLHFHRLNPEISFAGTRLKIPAENVAWPRSENPRVAGVSSFGLGGTNGHVILEEAPVLRQQNAVEGRTIPLPAYAWQRERFWMAEAAAGEAIGEKFSAQVRAAKIIHPLLGRRIDSAFIQGQLFESDLNTSAAPYLSAHSLGDRAILPFAAFLEIACSAIRQLAPLEENAIQKFVVREPLFLSPARCVLQVRVGDGTVEMASAAGTGWTAHAQGSFESVRGDVPPEELTKLRARCQKEVSPEEIYRVLEQSGLRYGKPFRTIDAAWSGKEESFAHLRLSRELLAQAWQYGIHPTLLDGCLQSVAIARTKSASDLFLPISVDRFQLRQTGVTELWVHTKIVASSQEAFSANITVMDDKGALVAEITGLQAKRTSVARLQHVISTEPAATYQVMWRPVPLQITSSNLGPGAAQRWLLIESRDGDFAHIANQLRQKGATCQVVHEDAVDQSVLTRYPWTGIVYDARTPADSDSATSWAHPEQHAVAFILKFVHSLQASQAGSVPRLWIVTSSTVAVTPLEDVSISQSPLWGMARTLMLEHPESVPVLLDAGSGRANIGATTDFAQNVVDEIAAGGPEALVAFRHGNRYVARLVESLPRPETAQRLRLDPSGRLEDLRIESSTRTEPVANEVEIRVRATGLNFRDVLTALGMLPARASIPGAECSGTIMRVGAAVREWKVGDDVLAFAPASMQTFVNVPAEFIVRKPAAMTFTEAAAIPVSFLTAEYGLHHLAHLAAGQRILVHAATGGLGLAAVQLAMRAGAQVFATAGSPEKRAYLRQMGVQHVFDSRSLRFRDDVLEATDEVGVDVVLNSLAGDFIRASLDTVATGGCFLEVGKRDLLTPEEVAALGKQIRYFPFDLGDVALRNPERIAMILHSLMTRFSAGELQPLPTTLYSFANATHAFRTMAHAQHIGKIVLGFGGNETHHNIREVVSQGTVLITGGLGALGTELTQWLASHGAGNIVLAGRSAVDSGEDPAIATLRNNGVDVAVEQVDVSSATEVEALLQRIRATRPPLRAVFHAAGVLQDAVLSKETWSGYRTTTAPKISGAWNLHHLTKSDPVELMVFFSSAASILGSPGQGSYAAGNAFLDALAHHRASRGMSTLSVNWGAWASAGMAARLTPEQSARWKRQGATPMEPSTALLALQRAIEARDTQVAIMDLDWEKFWSVTSARNDIPFFSELRSTRPAQHETQPTTVVASKIDILEALRSTPEFEWKFLLSAHIKVSARRALGLRESATISDSVALQDLGLDSLMALEMRNDLSQSLGIPLAAGLLFDYPSVDQLVSYITERLRPSVVPLPVAPRSQPNVDPADELQSMTEEEAELLLVQELDSVGRGKANA
jgi:acyl transferase domain-containing protein/acyl carrier protein